MGKRTVLRAIGLVVALSVIGVGIAALAQLVSGPSQRDLGPGIVVHQSEAPGAGTGFPEPTGTPADPSTTPTQSKDPKASATKSPSASSTPKPSKTSSPKPTQGPIKPLPPKAPVNDDDDDDDWDDDDDD